MLTDEQITVVAAETLVPRATVSCAMFALLRSGGQFTAAGVVAAVVGRQEPDPPARSMRFWSRGRTKSDPS